MPGVDRIFVVVNGEVRVEKNRAIQVTHDLPVLLKNGVFFFLFSLLHVFRYYLKALHLLPQLLFQRFLSLFVLFHLLHLTLITLIFKILLLLLLNDFLLDISPGLASDLLKLFNFDTLTLDFKGLLPNNPHIELYRLYFLIFPALLFETSELTLAFLAEEDIEHSIVAMLSLEWAEYLTEKCKGMIWTVRTCQELLGRRQNEEWPSGEECCFNGRVLEWLGRGKTQVDLFSEGC